MKRSSMRSPTRALAPVTGTTPCGGRKPIGSTGERLVSPHAPQMEGRWLGICPAGHTVTRMRRPSVPLACAVCSRSFRAENLLDWRLDGLPATPEQIGPRYAHALARLRRRTG